MSIDIYLNKIVEIDDSAPDHDEDIVAAESGCVIERVGGSVVEKHFKCKRKVFDIMDYDAPFTVRGLNRNDYEILDERPDHTLFVPKGERSNFFEDEEYARHIGIDNSEFVKKVDDAYCWVDYVDYARTYRPDFFEKNKIAGHLLKDELLSLIGKLKTEDPQVWSELMSRFRPGSLNNFDFATVIP